jgi:hypothetical protein
LVIDVVVGHHGGRFVANEFSRVERPRSKACSLGFILEWNNRNGSVRICSQAFGRTCCIRSSCDFRGKDHFVNHGGTTTMLCAWLAEASHVKETAAGRVGSTSDELIWSLVKKKLNSSHTTKHVYSHAWIRWKGQGLKAFLVRATIVHRDGSVSMPMKHKIRS